MYEDCAMYEGTRNVRTACGELFEFLIGIDSFESVFICVGYEQLRGRN